MKEMPEKTCLLPGAGKKTAKTSDQARELLAIAGTKGSAVRDGLSGNPIQTVQVERSRGMKSKTHQSSSEGTLDRTYLSSWMS